jgi:hypothetical protein
MKLLVSSAVNSLLGLKPIEGYPAPEPITITPAPLRDAAADLVTVTVMNLRYD